MTRKAAALPILLSAASIPADPVRAVPSAASGDARVDPTQRPARPASGRHTLHIESGPSGFRIIHTRPNGEREYWRRGISTHAEALLRARVVESLTGYEVIE